MKSILKKAEEVAECTLRLKCIDKFKYKLYESIICLDSDSEFEFEFLELETIKKMTEKVLENREKILRNISVEDRILIKRIRNGILLISTKTKKYPEIRKRVVNIMYNNPIIPCLYYLIKYQDDEEVLKQSIQNVYRLSEYYMYNYDNDTVYSLLELRDLLEHYRDRIRSHLGDITYEKARIYVASVLDKLYTVKDRAVWGTYKDIFRIKESYKFRMELQRLGFIQLPEIFEDLQKNALRSLKRFHPLYDVEKEIYSDVEFLFTH